MRIVFLHQPNDPYAETRIKYFVAKGHEVYSLVFNKGIVPKVITGVKLEVLPVKLFLKIPFAKRILYSKEIKVFTVNNKIDVFYVISALNSYYLKSSKAECNILEIQGSDVITQPQRFPVLKLFYKRYWKYADGITQDSRLAQSRGKPYMPEGILNETIEIGIDFEVFNPNVTKGLVREKFNLKNRPLIFHPRSIKKVYNLDTIIKSIPVVKKQFRDVCFMFTGYIESLNRKTRNFIKENNLNENIIFCGRLDHETEMKYYYKDADLVLSVPSSDSSPFSVYEAIATKTPVIISDLPWYKGKFIPHKHIAIVPPEDCEKLSKMIIQVLKGERYLDVNSAYDVIYDKINMQKENQKLENIFFSCLKKELNN